MVTILGNRGDGDELDTLCGHLRRASIGVGNAIKSCGQALALGRSADGRTNVTLWI